MPDSEQLLKDQYKDSHNLGTRIGIHELFSTNPKDWHQWLMEQYNIPQNATILELGCGNGAFWAKNKHHIHNSWNITLSDFSPGMLNDAQRNIGLVHNIEYEQINIMEIPKDTNNFDAVIANHMLYHVPDVSKALSEIQRVIRTDGKFYASTIGRNHMSELNELGKSFDSKLNFLYAHDHANAFGLENGKGQLNEYFSKVNLKLFEGGLEITEVQPVIDYLLSANKNSKEILTGDMLSEFKNYLEAELHQKNGKIFITKETGLFEAQI